jgi:DNA-binding transcriptional LysR family regulator
MQELFRFRQLIALAELGSFSRAAESLGISHSALSQTLAKLELQYATPLIIKKYRSIALTAAGECLVSAARSIIRDMKVAEGRIEAIATGQFTGTLRIGADPSIISEDLSGYVCAMLGHFPDADISVRNARWEEMHDLISSGQIDLYIGPLPDHSTDYIFTSRMKPRSMLLFCRSNHPGLENKPWPEMLTSFPVLGPSLPNNILKNLSARSASPTFFDQIANAQYSVVEDASLVREMVAASVGIGLIWEGAADISGRNLTALTQLQLSPFADGLSIACAKKDADFLPITRFFALVALV